MLEGSTKEERRIARLRERLQLLDVDAIILFSAEYDNRASVQYLSGFTGSAAVLIVGMTDVRLIVDSRYFIQAKEESPLPTGEIEGRDPWPVIRSTLADFKVKRLAVEEEKLNVLNHAALIESGVETVRVSKLVMQLRAVKEPEELVMMRRASRVAANAFESIISRIHIGMTEAQVGTLLANAMRERGAQQLVKGHFVVASGPRGASPHGMFTDRVLCDGDMVTMDFGAIVDGYVSDMSRTIGLGSVSRRMVEVYNTVLEANRLTLAAVSSKVSGAELNAVACKHIEACGFGSYIAHVAGHGIGLELHEMPIVGPLNTDPLPPGAVVTVEPGVYIPGLGGVRIEDDVIVTETGCEVMTAESGKELRILV